MQYGDREAVRTIVRDLVRPGTFDGDCGIIAYAVLTGSTYGTAYCTLRERGFTRGEGIGADDLASAIRDSLAGRAGEGLRLVAGSNLATFLEANPGWTGLAIVAGSTGHAIPVVDGFAYNTDEIHTGLPLVAVQDVRYS